MPETAARKAWLEANRERLRAYHKAWRDTHKDRIRAYGENYKAQDPEAFTRKATARSDAWRKAHPERAKEISRQAARRQAQKPGFKEKATIRLREWKKKNPDKVRVLAKRYENRHRDKLRAKAREYGQRNKEKRAETERRWRVANRDKRLVSQQKRRAREVGAPGSGITAAQWQRLKASYSYLCAYCGQKPRKLQLDHIEPLSKGGAHDITNAAPVCPACNQSKNNTPLLVWLARRAAA